MPNDINKLRRLMRRANYIHQETDKNIDMSKSLRAAWGFEEFRNTLKNGFARFYYTKADGTKRTALGTLAPQLIPIDKLPKGDDASDKIHDVVKAFAYFDLEKMEWRSFNVLNWAGIEQVWTINEI